MSWGGGHERVQETGGNGFWRKSTNRFVTDVYHGNYDEFFLKVIRTFRIHFLPLRLCLAFYCAGNQRYISNPYRFYVTSFTRILNKYICIWRKHPSTFDSSDQFYSDPCFPDFRDVRYFHVAGG